MSKLIDLSEFSYLVKDCAKVGIGGFDLHRKPLSLVLQLCEKRKLRELELFGVSLSLEADLLVGAGKVKKIITSYTGLENFGQCYFFRDSCERGDLTIIEMSTYAAILSLQAAALGIEYLSTKTMLHSDMAKNNALVKIIESPFSGGESVAVKSYHPDVALIHASEADKNGNVKIDSPPATTVDNFLARASNATFVSVERIVEKVENPTISGIYISHVICTPRGAAPTSLYPNQDVNLEAMELYCQGSKERNLEYCKEVITNAIKRRREN